MKFTSKKGFSLIELLVVVSMIGVLASIILSSLNNARTRVNLTQTIVLLKEIEKGFNYAILEDNRNSYWTSAEFGVASTTTVSIEDILAINSGAGSNISNYLNSGHQNFYNNDEVRYRERYTSTSSCDNAGRGVYIYLPRTLFTRAEFITLNELIDGPGDTLNCGKFRNYGGSGGFYYYMLSDDIDIIEFN